MSAHATLAPDDGRPIVEGRARRSPPGCGGHRVMACTCTHEPSYSSWHSPHDSAAGRRTCCVLSQHRARRVYRRPTNSCDALQALDSHVHVQLSLRVRRRETLARFFRAVWALSACASGLCMGLWLGRRAAPSGRPHDKVSPECGKERRIHPIEKSTGKFNILYIAVCYIGSRKGLLPNGEIGWYRGNMVKHSYP